MVTICHVRNQEITRKHGDSTTLPPPSPTVVGLCLIESRSNIFAKIAMPRKKKLPWFALGSFRRLSACVLLCIKNKSPDPEEVQTGMGSPASAALVDQSSEFFLSLELDPLAQHAKKKEKNTASRNQCWTSLILESSTIRSRLLTPTTG